MDNTDIQTWSTVIQAVSSIVAIVIAISLPIYMDKKARERQNELDKIKEKNMQVALLPNMYELRFKVLDFIELCTGSKDIHGEPIDMDSGEFNSDDSDFLKLLPNFIKILTENFFISDLQFNIQKLSGEIFIFQDMIEQNMKLQRRGYHAAWINHQDDFIEKAKNIFMLSNEIIKFIEQKKSIKSFI